MINGDARDNIGIRCPNRKHFDVERGSQGIARVPCREKLCRQSPDERVMHYFDLATGELLETRRTLRERAAPPPPANH